MDRLVFERGDKGDVLVSAAGDDDEVLGFEVAQVARVVGLGHGFLAEFGGDKERHRRVFPVFYINSEPGEAHGAFQAGTMVERRADPQAGKGGGRERMKPGG